MCGIFGFASNAGDGPDLDRLRDIALVTQTRGMHAFGLAWINRAGHLQSFKSAGPAEQFLDVFDLLRGAIMVAGHCRYATHGSPADNRNNHPHASGSGVIVHNGVVLNDAELLRRHGLRRTSECDSETLALLIAHAGGPLERRARWAMNEARGDQAIIGLWAGPPRMVVARRGRPLCWSQTRRGFYLASLPNGMPGEPAAVVDASARAIIFQRGRLRLGGPAIWIAGAEREAACLAE